MKNALRKLYTGSNPHGSAERLTMMRDIFAFGVGATQLRPVGNTLHVFCEEVFTIPRLTDAVLNEKIDAYAHRVHVTPRDFRDALRYAITGQMIGPSLYDCMVILGRDEVLRRIGLALTAAEATPA